MSYCTDLKKTLAECEVKKKCCRRALLYGILTMRAEAAEGYEVFLTLPQGEVATLAAREIHALLGAAPDVRPLGEKGSRVRISFSSEECHSHLLSGELTYPQKSRPCGQCLSHFLRGIFLAAGRMSDFTKLYRLEISANRFADALYDLLSEAVMPPKLQARRNERLLYYKTNDEICDFLTAIGAEHVTFDLINNTITAGYRGAVNRRMNCEMRNIGRSVDAAERLIGLIERLIEADKLKKLPDELRSTALLRVEHKTLSIAALARKSTPPVSKSGMNHRLEKIEKIAEELLKGEERRG